MYSPFMFPQSHPQEETSNTLTIICCFLFLVVCVVIGIVIYKKTQSNSHTSLLIYLSRYHLIVPDINSDNYDYKFTQIMSSTNNYISCTFSDTAEKRRYMMGKIICTLSSPGTIDEDTKLKLLILFLEILTSPDGKQSLFIYDPVIDKITNINPKLMIKFKDQTKTTLTFSEMVENLLVILKDVSKEINAHPEKISNCSSCNTILNVTNT